MADVDPSRLQQGEFRRHLKQHGSPHPAVCGRGGLLTHVLRSVAVRTYTHTYLPTIIILPVVSLVPRPRDLAYLSRKRVW